MGEGDEITIDVDARRLDMALEAEEIDRRGPATPRPARATASSRAELLGREPARGADPTARRSKAVGVPGSYG
jgi:dihydroxyacid dehydratase/phosphogluconate dehydratase